MRFSVVIPAFNEEMFIGACLASLAEQDYREPFEVIVVDNNSTDATATIARHCGATVVFESIPGVCQARQHGTTTARGDIVISTDADTTFDRGWLSAIDSSFDRDPSCVAVTGPCQWVDAPRWGRIYQHLLFGTVRIVKRLTGRVVYISATNIAFRKSAWTGYDTRLTQGGDELDLLRRLQSRGPVRFDPAIRTYTSARRMDRGLFYNLVCTFFFYYFLGYTLNRLFGRQILGTAPPFRASTPPDRAFRRVCRTTAVAAALSLGGLLLFNRIDLVRGSGRRRTRDESQVIRTNAPEFPATRVHPPVSGVRCDRGRTGFIQAGPGCAHPRSRFRRSAPG